MLENAFRDKTKVSYKATYAVKGKFGRQVQVRARAPHGIMGCAFKGSRLGSSRETTSEGSMDKDLNLKSNRYPAPKLTL